MIRRKQPPRLASRRVTCSFSPENFIFNFYNPSPQSLSLPSTLLTNVIEKLKAKSVFKLTKTCKYMKYYCEKIRGKALDSLWIGQRLHYDFTYCMAVQIDETVLMLDTFLTGLSIEKRLSCDFTSKPDTVSKILKLSKRCVVKDLYMENQTMTCKEFEILCKNVRSCLVSCLTFTDQSDKGMLIDIFERIPNAIQIEIQSWNQGIYYTPTTALSLLNLKHNVKIKYFEIDSVSEDFEPNSFGKFAKNNFSRKCEIILHFQESASTLILKNFKETIKPAIRELSFRSIVANRHHPTPFAVSGWQLSIKEYTIYKFDKIFHQKKGKKRRKSSGFAKHW
jgi:hypothetical protein